MKSKSLYSIAFTIAAAVFLLVSPAEAKPPKPDVNWVFGPDPNTRGGTCRKLPAGHVATVKITIAGKTRTFTFRNGTTGSEIGWWTFNKTHNKVTDGSFEITVKDASGRQVAQSKYTTRIRGSSTLLNLSAPPKADAQKFSLYARCQYKGPFHIYLKDPSSVGRETVYMLFSLK